MHRPALLLLLLIAGLFAPGIVHAQVKRCTAADGTPAFLVTSTAGEATP